MPDFNPDEYLSADFNPDSYLGAIPESANNIDVPAGGAGQAFPERPQQAERSIGDVAEGIGEAALTTATGATGGALGFGAGTVGGIIGELTGMLKPGEGLELAQKLGSMLTYEPRGEAGKEYVGDIGETLGVLPPVGLTGGITPKLGAPKSALGKKMMESTNERIQKSFSGKPVGEKSISQMYGKNIKSAIKQGFDERTVRMISESSPINKRKYRKMVSVLEAGMKDLEHEQTFRPADVAGDSLLKQVDFVRSNNQKAGKQLGRVAKNLKGKDVDVIEPVNKFFNDLDDIGVIVDDKGNINFTGSMIEFSGPAKTLISNTITKLRRKPAPDAFEAHEFKKFLDEDLKHGKKLEGGVSGKVESVLGDLRRGINESISSEYPLYKEANKRFSDTVQSLDMLQDVVGKKLNQTGPHADKAFGKQLRALMNDTNGRANLLDAVDSIEQTAHKYGGSFDDNILTQMLFADELEIAFGGGSRKGFKSQIKQAGVEAGIDLAQMSVIGAGATVLKAGIKKARGVNQKNQLKALKRLLNEK